MKSSRGSKTRKLNPSLGLWYYSSFFCIQSHHLYCVAAPPGTFQNRMLVFKRPCYRYICVNVSRTFSIVNDCKTQSYERTSVFNGNTYFGSKFWRLMVLPSIYHGYMSSFESILGFVDGNERKLTGSVAQIGRIQGICKCQISENGSWQHLLKYAAGNYAGSKVIESNQIWGSRERLHEIVGDAIPDTYSVNGWFSKYQQFGTGRQCPTSVNRV